MAQGSLIYKNLKDNFFDGIRDLSGTDLAHLVAEIFKEEQQPAASTMLYMALGELDYGDEYETEHRKQQVNAFALAISKEWRGLVGGESYQASSHLAALAMCIVGHPHIKPEIKDEFRQKFENEILIASDDDVSDGIKKTGAYRLIFLFRSSAEIVTAFWGNETAEKSFALLQGKNPNATEGYLETAFKLIERAEQKGWNTLPLREQLIRLQIKSAPDAQPAS